MKDYTKVCVELDKQFWNKLKADCIKKDIEPGEYLQELIYNNNVKTKNIIQLPDETYFLVKAVAKDNHTDPEIIVKLSVENQWRKDSETNFYYYIMDSILDIKTYIDRVDLCWMENIMLSMAEAFGKVARRANVSRKIEQRNIIKRRNIKRMKAE